MLVAYYGFGCAHNGRVRTQRPVRFPAVVVFAAAPKAEPFLIWRVRSVHLEEALMQYLLRMDTVDK